MKRKMFVSGVLLVCFVGVLGVFRRHSEALRRGSNQIDAKLVALQTFNDCESFSMDAQNPRRFVYVENPSANEAYLRFRIDDFNPHEYVLTMRLRARPEVLKGGAVRSAKSIIYANRGTINGDVATYEIDMSDFDTFMWVSNSCYVGICIPKFLLKPGDVVELLDFKFSLR